MKQSLLKLSGLLLLLSLFLTACGGNEEASGEGQAEKQKEEPKEEKKENTDTEANETQVISYLGEDYEVPAQVNDIATASLEAMEDAAMLGVKPMATITYGGEIPAYVAEELEGAEDIGSKRQPSSEKLLSLQPDVILGTSKFQPDVVDKLNQVAPMFPVSHISTNWEENLKLMGKLTGKEDKAEEVISQYKEDAAAMKEKIHSTVDGKKVMLVRVRRGSLYVYSEDVYFNSVLYKDLGIEVPEAIKNVKAQEQITLEKLAEINPDYLFIQFAESENPESKEAVEELQNNPIFSKLNASQNDNVFVNIVDPMHQGGTAWSKTAFLDAIGEIAGQ